MIGMNNFGGIIGRLTKDVEERRTTSDIPVCNFTVAVDRPGSTKDNRITDFFDVTAWRQTAQLICKYYKKGDPIAFLYSLQNDNYQDKDGNERKKTVLQAEQLYFLPSRRQQTTQEETMQQEPTTAADAGTPVDTDELPF